MKSTHNPVQKICVGFLLLLKMSHSLLLSTNKECLLNNLCMRCMRESKKTTMRNFKDPVAS